MRVGGIVRKREGIRIHLCERILAVEHVVAEAVGVVIRLHAVISVDAVRKVRFAYKAVSEAVRFFLQHFVLIPCDFVQKYDIAVLLRQKREFFFHAFVRAQFPVDRRCVVSVENVMRHHAQSHFFGLRLLFRGAGGAPEQQGGG